MAHPIVFISRNRIKPGSFDDFNQHYHESVPLTEAGKPDTLVQLAYVNDNNTELVIVRVFPDPDALNHQLQGADERSKIVYKFIEPKAIEIFGAPNVYALEMMKKVAGSGIDVSINPQYLGGFIRLKPG